MGSGCQSGAARVWATPPPPHNSFGKWTWMELVIRAGCLLSVGLPYLVIWSWVGQGRVVYWEALEIGPDKYKRGGGVILPLSAIKKTRKIMIF